MDGACITIANVMNSFCEKMKEKKKIETLATVINVNLLWKICLFRISCVHHHFFFICVHIMRLACSMLALSQMHI